MGFIFPSTRLCGTALSHIRQSGLRVSHMLAYVRAAPTHRATRCKRFALFAHRQPSVQALPPTVIFFKRIIG
jgi:hypothetical protein